MKRTKIEEKILNWLSDKVGEVVERMRWPVTQWVTMTFVVKPIFHISHEKIGGFCGLFFLMFLGTWPTILVALLVCPIDIFLQPLWWLFDVGEVYHQEKEEEDED